MGDSDLNFGCGGLVLVAIFAIISLIVFADQAWITDADGLAYIKDMTNSARVQWINDDGNENILVHEVDNVTFDVYLWDESGNKTRAQFRCTDGVWQDLICKGYNGE